MTNRKTGNRTLIWSFGDFRATVTLSTYNGMGPGGLEPPTPWASIRCSTSWAIVPKRKWPKLSFTNEIFFKGCTAIFRWAPKTYEIVAICTIAFLLMEFVHFQVSIEYTLIQASSETPINLSFNVSSWAWFHPCYQAERIFLSRSRHTVSPNLI